MNYSVVKLNGIKQKVSIDLDSFHISEFYKDYCVQYKDRYVFRESVIRTKYVIMK